MCIENQTVLKIETVLISIMFLKLPMYWSYNRVIQKIFKTVLIIQTVLIIETKEYELNFLKKTLALASMICFGIKC